MALSTTMINAAVRRRLGAGLAELYEANATAVPRSFVEQLARLAVAEEVVAFDGSLQPHNKPAAASAHGW
jgi:hypothetical protein